MVESERDTDERYARPHDVLDRERELPRGFAGRLDERVCGGSTSNRLRVAG
jgi:hypothetical protein